jgi:hypothetical protein
MCVVNAVILVQNKNTKRLSNFFTKDAISLYSSAKPKINSPMIWFNLGVSPLESKQISVVLIKIISYFFAVLIMFITSSHMKNAYQMTMTTNARSVTLTILRAARKMHCKSINI